MSRENQPSHDEWRALHESWMQVKDLAPWDWMYEANLFGVQNPETDEIGYVSVMGNFGEHYAMALYQGARGLYKFWQMQRELEFNPFLVIETPQLQASWEDRNNLDNTDRQVIKDLGLKFRGKKAWPQFQSYRPGHVPWYIEADEARFLTVAIQQLLDVAPRFKANPGLLPNPATERYLVRVPRQESNSLVWEDTIQPMPPEPKGRLYMPMDTDLLDEVKTLPQHRDKIEMDLFLIPSPIREHKDKRPYFPYMLMAVHGRSGAIMGGELLQPGPDLTSVWEQVPLTTLAYFASFGARPRMIYVTSSRLAELLERLAQELGCRVIVRRNLRYLGEAKSSLMNYLGGGMPPM
ncbi:MAG: hypothetical protein JXA10_13690 [Anaerolineae bacterium]|nr:hypothetical protein [Anaerolineae bacterium]